MIPITPAEAQRLSFLAGQVFQPRTPISTRESLAGRWDQLTAVADAVGQIGLHVVIYGERGVGKTSLANVVSPVLHAFDEQPNAFSSDPAGPRLVVKVNAHLNDTFEVIWQRALDEISISEERPVIGFHALTPERRQVPLRRAWNIPNELSIDVIRRALGHLPDAVFIFDEFDRVNQTAASQFTDLIKALSDFQSPVTMVLVGVADTVDDLIESHPSISRALVQVHMPRMRPDELMDILHKAEEKLGLRYEPDAADRIVRMSLGLPHYTHLIGLASARKACDRLSGAIGLVDVSNALGDASRQAEQSLINEFTQATRSAQPDALYLHVLLACAIVASSQTDELGYFQPSSLVKTLGSILPGRRIEIATFNRHLAEFCDAKRGSVLQRTGQERAFRYRFRNPLLPPYVIMKGISSEIVNMDQVDTLASALE